jgi:hypothetical protein
MRPHKSVPVKGRDLDHGRSPEATSPDADPLLITSGPMLCRLRVWSDEEWDALPVPRRPAQHARVAGLGWIGAVPIAWLN